MKRYAAAVLFTFDMEQIARFYREIIGMRFMRADSDHVVLENESFRLIVHLIKALNGDKISRSVPPVIRQKNPIKLSFAVDSIANARAIAPSLGGSVYGPEQEWFYDSMKICEGWDPDGNVFQLVELTEK
jgi:predicted enzyme related to lactoylglutathione lyase